MRLYGTYNPTNGSMCVNDLDSKHGHVLLTANGILTTNQASSILKSEGFEFDHWVIATKTYGHPMLVAGGLELK